MRKKAAILCRDSPVRLRQFCMLGVPTSKPYISACVENAYKGPYVCFCDLRLLQPNLAPVCMQAKFQTNLGVFIVYLNKVLRYFILVCLIRSSPTDMKIDTPIYYRNLYLFLRCGIRNGRLWQMNRSRGGCFEKKKKWWCLMRN